MKRRSFFGTLFGGFVAALRPRSEEPKERTFDNWQNMWREMARRHREREGWDSKRLGDWASNANAFSGTVKVHYLDGRVVNERADFLTRKS